MQETTKILLNWSVLAEIRGSIREHGFRFPLLAAKWLYYRAANILHEMRFDRKYGVKTGFIVSADELNFADAEIQKKAVRYRPTPPYTIIKGLRALKRVSSLEFSNETFIDYGCGAGRVMIIAAESGFGKVIGVEFSPSLVKICEANIKAYSRLGEGRSLTVIENNAMHYLPPSDANVFFFFVPFEIDVYTVVINRIRRSVKEHPRTVYILDIGAKMKSFNFEHEGCQLIGGAEKLSIFRYPPA